MAENSQCSLADRECIPCRGGISPLAGESLQQYMKDLAGDWVLVEDQRLEKT